MLPPRLVKGSGHGSLQTLPWVPLASRAPLGPQVQDVQPERNPAPTRSLVWSMQRGPSISRVIWGELPSSFGPPFPGLLKGHDGTVRLKWENRYTVEHGLPRGMRGPSVPSPACHSTPGGHVIVPIVQRVKLRAWEKHTQKCRGVAGLRCS